MRKVLALAAICGTLLYGCASYGDLTSDAYDPGSASQTRFTMDSAQCAARAEDARNYALSGISGTHTERHELFNRAFDNCMRGAGYVRRDWSPDIPSHYAIDPFPG